jgi:hypothetical protein
MAFDPISAVIGLVNTGIDKFLPDKMSEAEKENLKKDLAIHATQESRKVDSDFRQFVLQYEGSAADVPKFIVVFRSLIRPVFTCLIGYIDFLFFTTSTEGWSIDSISMLKAINIIVLGFWFGERALQRSGLIDVLKIRASKNG